MNDIYQLIKVVEELRDLSYTRPLIVDNISTFFDADTAAQFLANKDRRRYIIYKNGRLVRLSMKNLYAYEIAEELERAL